MVLDIVTAFLLGGCLIGVAYSCAAAYAVRRFAVVASDPVGWQPAVAVLKPLCGAEPGLYENICSFCDLDYPEFQVIFGVNGSTDPSVQVVHRLQKEYPEIDITLVADPRVKGQNLKVSNLQNMMSAARYDVLVISDSDIRVTPDYLTQVVAPLQNPEVGLVTCLYRGRPIGGRWSQLGAMGINFGFLPSALFSRLIGVDQGCFGATIALRRDSLDRIGGFDIVQDFLTDDYALGQAVRRAEQRVVISNLFVDNFVTETSFRSLFLHEVRWGRTLRSVVPAGYVASVITHPMPLGVLAVFVSGFAPEALLICITALLARHWMVREIERQLKLAPAPYWLVPIRDIISFAVHVTSLWGSRVVWRGRSLKVAAGGRLMLGSRS